MEHTYLYFIGKFWVEQKKNPLFYILTNEWRLRENNIAFPGSMQERLIRKGILPDIWLI